MNSELLVTQDFSLRINKKMICHDLNLKLNPGDFWGILGPNGCGKTTLLQTLAGLKNNFGGEILFENMPLHKIKRKRLATKIGILFQEMHFVFPQSVFDFCLASRFPFSTSLLENEKIILEALKVVELENFLNKNILELSGGEKRRLTIAALLAQTPQLFLLDEPTNHLDIRHQLRVMEQFKKLTQENKTVMMAVHDLSLAKHFCNKLLMIFENSEVLQGSTHHIFTKENLEQLFHFRSIDGGVGGAAGVEGGLSTLKL